MNKFGLFIKDHFTSDNPHLIINLLKTPPHMDMIEREGGTALVSVGPGSQKETIFEIEHGLDYTPEVTAYFYVISYFGSTTNFPAGAYSADSLQMSLTNGAVFDTLYLEADDTHFRIVHELDDPSGFGYTSEADVFELRIKYYIISKDSKQDSYDTRPY